MSENIKISAREPQILSKYLIGKECTEEIATYYAEALSKHNAILNDSEQKTWDRMLWSGFYLKLVDSGLAISNPQSSLRKRIFIMLTLLEVSPLYTEFFLPQERTFFYIIPLGLRAGLSALYLVIGTIWVKVFHIN